MVRRLRYNLFSLLLTQGGQYVASLVLLPVLTRRLGVEGYGELGFCLAIVGYLGLVVEWGYSSTSTKQIAVFKDDLRERSQIFWNVFFGKAFLLLVAAVLLRLFLALDWVIIGDQTLLWMAFLMVVANALAPNYFYHGLEKLDFPLAINVGFRFLSIPFILVFVNDASDVSVAQGLMSVALLLATCFNLYYLRRLRLVCWIKPTLRQIVCAMKNAAPLFLSTAIQGLFFNSLTVILGFVSGIGAVGVYTAAINLYKAGQGLLLPLSQTIYPRLSYLFHHDMRKGLDLLGRIVLLQTPIALVVCASLAWGSSWLLPILIGNQFDRAVPIFQVLTIALFLYSLSNLLGLQLMVLLNTNVFYTKTVAAAVSVSVIAAIFMSQLWGAIGTALAIIICEMSVIAASVAYLKRRAPLVFNALLGAR